MGLGTSFGVYASTDVAAAAEDTAAFYGGRGLFAGNWATGNLNTIDYVTIATTGNATDFGDLTDARYGSDSACSNGTRGVFGGGHQKNIIDYVTIATTGDATDFGDLTVARYGSGACSNGTRGVWGGGSSYNTIDYVTIATTGDATDFGDLTVGRSNLAACSGD